MKSLFISTVTVLLGICHVNAAQVLLPSYLPPAPVKEKAVSEYTAGDVVACVSTEDLPPDHNYCKDKLYLSGLKAKWPGAKDAANIDAMVQFLLDAPANTDENELNAVSDNLRYVFRNGMDVSSSAKADALVRIVAAQTEVPKVRRAKTFATSMFRELLDPRLLEYERERLDDATVVGDMVREGSVELIHDLVTVRRDSRDTILWWLKEYLKMMIDESGFRIKDEAAGCAVLKTWLVANWAQIVAKCEEQKTAANRKLDSVVVRTWNARP